MAGVGPAVRAAVPTGVTRRTSARLPSLAGGVGCDVVVATLNPNVTINS